MKKIICSLIAVSCFVNVWAQKLDTSDVIITAADQFFFWYGYNNNLNDTTRLLKSVIAKLNPVADSILKAKEKEDKIIYGYDIKQYYKSNFFSLAASSILIDSNQYDAEKLTIAFDGYVDKNNSFSVAEWYINGLGNRWTYASKLYDLNKDRNWGAGWNTGSSINLAIEQTIKHMGMKSGKSVTVNCGTGSHVYYDGNYAGETGVELILFKGSHLIEIKEGRVVKCRHSLVITQNDDGSPIVITCNNPAIPCTCKPI
jgi:hypothetical protein